MNTFPESASARIAVTVVIGALGVGSIIASGGGGGGSGDGDGPPILLPLYQYTIENQAGGPSAFLASATVDAQLYSISIALPQGTGVRGTYAPGTEALTVDAGSVLNANTDLATPIVGNIQLEVTETISVPVTGSRPTSGAAQVTVGGDVVGVTITADGVELRLNGGAPQAFTWDAFEEFFLGAPVPAWQEAAAAGYQLLDLVLDQVDVTVTALKSIDDDLASGPRAASCDLIPGVPPAGILPQGETVLTWLGSGSVSPGDDFNWTFTDCWVNDPADDYDDLVRGQIDLRNWIENVDSDNRLVSAGFAAFGGPGGLYYQDFELGETVEAPPGVFNRSPVFPTLNGGLSVFFFEGP
jgi:hypothetical protein